jgi:hypothetical protein
LETIGSRGGGNLKFGVTVMSALSKSCKRIEKKVKEDVRRLVALALEPRQRKGDELKKEWPL